MDGAASNSLADDPRILLCLAVSWSHYFIALFVSWDFDSVAIIKNIACTRSWRGASENVLPSLEGRPHHSAMESVQMAAKRCPPGVDW